ncbi:riboflavin synthase domain-like protein [Mycena albidolilacea]|uniref:NADPH-dependent diflavin oxidoreductase 1 n=1 Tax=Mycena albidolilacea TaxID=1033008 RepID=A0AAD7A939_9AGAR|nr:riboflavin synthase domain-like protein [Mycena albidolilacea]
MVEDSERSVLILYATETGTAQDVAERLARQCRRIHLTCRVLSTDKYSLSDLISEPLVLFVISTTGSGAEPRSMTLMWKTLLRSDLPPDLFDDLSFAVFGLGDTAYEKFCWPAKKLCRRLLSLGATEICDRGEGDDQDPLGIDGALGSWMDKIMQALLLTYPLPDNVEIIPAAAIPAARVTMVEDPSFITSSSPPLNPGFYSATVKCNNRITAGDWYQDVRHFEFDFDDDIRYSPGDVAVIRPFALFSDVGSFLRTMDWLDVADVPFRITHTMTDQSLPEHLPEAVSPRVLFTQYLDFNAVPRRSFFEYLRHFTSDELEREKLDEFLSREGADDLYDYCYRVRRTIHEVLAEFRHVKIPMEYIFDVFPPLRPRQFSIASSVKRFPSQINLCVAIVKYRTKLKISRRGVCTTFLASLKPGDKMEIGLQKGLINLPADNNTPVICIGPGTGVAPMRAVIQERLHMGATNNTLYFGCRSASKDQHYASEWSSCASTGNLAYRAAFSRDGPEGTKRTYVQDLLQEDAERIWGLLQAGAYVFISGSANKMPAAVKSALCFAAETYGKLETSAAAELISAMEAKGQLIEECWS